MGIEQVSLFFYTPGWNQKRTFGDSALRADGSPVRLVRPERSKDSDSPPVLFGVMKEWLESRGFKTADWGDGSILDYGEVQSLFGKQQEIRIHIHAESDEVAELYCRFTIPSPRDWFSPLQRWSDFMGVFLQQFQLRLGEEDRRCDRARFEAAVLADDNYITLSNAVD